MMMRILQFGSILFLDLLSCLTWDQVVFFPLVLFNLNLPRSTYLFFSFLSFVLELLLSLPPIFAKAKDIYIYRWSSECVYYVA